MPGQQLITQKTKAAASRSICQISTKALFGYLDYTLPSKLTAPGGLSDVIILYGDNGSGKTTILELAFHLLSPARKRGHRNAITKIPFKSFQVGLSDGTVVTAARSTDRITGA